MTLIAGFRIHRIPVLIGDFKITQRDLRAVAMTRRKVVRLSARLALSLWTGTEIAAHDVLKSLYDHVLHCRILDKATLDSILTNVRLRSQCTARRVYSAWTPTASHAVFDGEQITLLRFTTASPMSVETESKLCLQVF